ncbi:MAG: hypothetical protein IT367_20360 [Candidatus Hydrogenedentes bacterium]|nr:hypothetical protein [Candidatus Hydrogenedentota bacterium]
MEAEVTQNILVIDNNKQRLEWSLVGINSVGHLSWKAWGRANVTEDGSHGDRTEEFLPEGEALDIPKGDMSAVLVIMHASNPRQRAYIAARPYTPFLLVSGDEKGVCGEDYANNCLGYPAPWRPECYSSAEWRAFLDRLGSLGDWKGKGPCRAKISTQLEILSDASQSFGMIAKLSDVIHELYLRSLAFRIQAQVRSDEHSDLSRRITSQRFPSPGITFLEFIKSILRNEFLKSNLTLQQIASTLGHEAVLWPGEKGTVESVDAQVAALEQSDKSRETLNDWVKRLNAYLRGLRIALNR